MNRLVPAAALGAAVLAGCGGRVARSNTLVKLPPNVTPARVPQGAHGVVDGADVQTKFGDIQVALSLRNGRITAVRALRLPFDRRRSQRISAQAGPILKQETLAKQSSNINLVSGATYTSDAWAESVQTALTTAATRGPAVSSGS
jgi:uncharacterized protein with FMN-binding domain